MRAVPLRGPAAGGVAPGGSGLSLLPVEGGSEDCARPQPPLGQGCRDTAAPPGQRPRSSCRCLPRLSLGVASSAGPCLGWSCSEGGGVMGAQVFSRFRGPGPAGCLAPRPHAVAVGQSHPPARHNLAIHPSVRADVSTSPRPQPSPVNVPDIGVFAAPPPPPFSLGRAPAVGDGRLPARSAADPAVRAAGPPPRAAQPWEELSWKSSPSAPRKHIGHR